jgi:hypothetical protein
MVEPQLKGDKVIDLNITTLLVRPGALFSFFFFLTCSLPFSFDFLLQWSLTLIFVSSLVVIEWRVIFHIPSGAMSKLSLVITLKVGRL